MIFPVLYSCSQTNNESCLRGSISVSQKRAAAQSAIFKGLGYPNKSAKRADTDIFALLATEGMLVKRPLVIGDGFVLVGFKEAEWEASGLVPLKRA